jgi:hypothetical protein
MRTRKGDKVVEKTSNGTKNLLWIGSAILICCTVSWFLDQNIRIGISDYNRLMESRIQKLEERFVADIREIKADIKIILAKLEK